jgi:hypothetical protein
VSTLEEKLGLGTAPQQGDGRLMDLLAAERLAASRFDKVHDARSAPPQREPNSAPQPQRLTPEQRRQMLERRQRMDQRRQEMERQKAVERIKAQVVYSPFITSPQQSGYAPIPRGLDVQRQGGSIPIGIDANQLSPQDQMLLLALANTGGR